MSSVAADQQAIYFESRQRYIAYYLKYPTSIGFRPTEVQADLLNLQQAFRSVAEANNHGLILEFWHSLADFFWDHGYWQLYQEWAERTLSSAKQLRRADSEAWVLSELGWLRLEQGEFEKSKDLLGSAKNIFYQIEDRHGICMIERYLGALAYRLGNYLEADQYLAKALQLAAENAAAEQTGAQADRSQNQIDYDLVISEIRNLQGSVAKQKGDFAQARLYYEESVRLVEKKGSKWRLTAVLRNLARLDFQSGQLEVARDQFERAIAVCYEVDRKDMLYGCQLGLAQVELKLGQVDRARALAIGARAGFVQMGMQRDIEIANRFLETFVEQSRAQPFSP